MTEQGRDKFFTRMLTKKEEVERFALNRPSRNIDEQREELRLIREQAGGGNAGDTLGSGVYFRGRRDISGGEPMELVERPL